MPNQKYQKHFIWYPGITVHYILNAFFVRDEQLWPEKTLWKSHLKKKYFLLTEISVLKVLDSKKKIIFEIKWREDGRKISTAIESFFEELWMELLFVKVFPAVWFVLIVIDQMTSGFPPKKRRAQRTKGYSPFSNTISTIFRQFYLLRKNVFNPKTF